MHLTLCTYEVSTIRQHNYYLQLSMSMSKYCVKYVRLLETQTAQMIERIIRGKT